MNRLGAYKVDRRKKNPVYLEALKTYSTVVLEKGCHSLFFPGGTRSRSGNLEGRLKLGLLSTAFEAQKNIFKEKENIYFIGLNYHWGDYRKYRLDRTVGQLYEVYAGEISDLREISYGKFLNT